MEVLTERSSRVVSFLLHRASARRDQGQFLVEGPNAVEAALDAGQAQVVLVREDDVDRHRDVLAVAADRGVGVLEVTARAVAKLADATTPPGIFAVCGLLDVALDEVLTKRAAAGRRRRTA